MLCDIDSIPLATSPHTNELPKFGSDEVFRSAPLYMTSEFTSNALLCEPRSIDTLPRRRERAAKAMERSWRVWVYKDWEGRKASSSASSKRGNKGPVGVTVYVILWAPSTVRTLRSRKVLSDTTFSPTWELIFLPQNRIEPELANRRRLPTCLHHLTRKSSTRRRTGISDSTRRPLHSPLRSTASEWPL